MTATGVAAIGSILALPFHEWPALEALGIGDDDTIDVDYAGFGWTRVERFLAYDAELTDKGWHASRVVRTESIEVIVPKRTYSRSPRR